MTESLAFLPQFLKFKLLLSFLIVNELHVLLRQILYLLLKTHDFLSSFPILIHQWYALVKDLLTTSSMADFDGSWLQVLAGVTPFEISELIDDLRISI
jgi:hypothetical protein